MAKISNSFQLPEILSVELCIHARKDPRSRKQRAGGFSEHLPGATLYQASNSPENPLPGADELNNAESLQVSQSPGARTEA